MPALISIIAFFLSASSFGNKNNFNIFSFISCCFFNSSSSSEAIVIKSLPLFVSLIIFSNSFFSFSKEMYFLACLIISLRSEYSFDFSANCFFSVFPDDSSFSNKECLDINSSILFVGTINCYFEFLLLFPLLDLQLLKLNLLLILSLFVCLINKAYYYLFRLQ